MPKSICSERAKSLTLVFIAGVTACEEQEARPMRCSDLAGSTQLPDVPLLYSTEHLDIHVDEDRMFCAGSALEYERFFQYVGAELGAELPTRTPVFLSDAVGDYCQSGRGGCIKKDGVVFTNPGFSFHELTHAAGCEWRNGSTNYLSEGLAVSFESPPLEIVSASAWIDPREFIVIGQPEPFRRHYSQSGHLIRWLLEERGPEAFRVLFETSPRAGGQGVFDALASAYGQDAESLLAEYEASAPYMWVPHRQCADIEVLKPRDGSWEFSRIFDCDDPATSGPWEREGARTNSDYLAHTTMYQSFLLEIESPGSYQFQSGDGTFIELERCLDEVALSEEQAKDLWLEELLYPGLEGPMDVELPVGTYRVDVQRQYAAPHPVWLRIVPNSG